VAQDRYQWWTSAYTVMNFRVPKREGNFLKKWASISFSKKFCSMDLEIATFLV
jgi:hypothetical protein